MGDVSKLDYALAWAARGFRVFPLQPGGKLPLSKGWPDTATSDPETIRELWTDPVTGWSKDYNIGCLTDDLIVVDIDDKNGKPGSETFAALGLPTETLTVRTPSGGRHVYYRGDGTHQPNSAGRLGLGLDVRAWHGFVVAPGSETDTGQYVVARDLTVADSPVALTTRLGVAGSEPAGSGPTELDKPHHVVRAIEYLERDAQLAVEGAGGDATTFRVAANLKDYGVSQDVALELMLGRWNDRCAPPWDADELACKVANAYEYGRVTAGAHTPEAAVAGIALDDAPTPAPSRAWFNHGDPHETETWLFFETLPKVGVAALTGPAGGGKTFLALEIARCLATEKAFFGTPPDFSGATLFLFAGTEGSGLGQRLDALGEVSSLPIAATRIGVLSQQNALADLVRDIEAKAVEMDLIYGVPVRMVVLETLSASGLLKDENDNSEAALAMSALAAVANRLGLLFVVTHHPPKSGAGSRGAGAISASADYMLEIVREEREAIRTLELAKGRNAAQRKIGQFTLVPVQVGTDSRGRAITSLTVSQSTEVKTAVREPKSFTAFMECLDWTLVECAELIEGVSCAPLAALRDTFNDRFRATDRGNVSRNFKAAHAWAVELGFAEQRLFEGATYINPRRNDP